MTDNALKCKFNGGMMPIGYVIDAEQHFRIDPLTAPFVLEAFKRYDGGETISSIMNWLNEQGLTNTRGQKMTFNSVGHILHNRRYIGEFRYRDVIVPDYIFGRTDDPHGMIYNNCVKLGLNNPEMARFVEMCFDPGSAMNERLKATLVQMLSEVDEK